VVEDFELALEGWIQLQRSLLAEPWWLEKPFTKAQVFVEILAKATFKESREIEYAGKRIILVRGQAFIAKRALAKYAGWSRPRLERFLKYLENQKGERYAITQEAVNRSSENPVERPVAVGTIITFINFESLCPK